MLDLHGQSGLCAAVIRAHHTLSLLAGLLLSALPAMAQPRTPPEVPADLLENIGLYPDMAGVEPMPVIAPVVPLDPQLMAPLSPLATFDLAPRADLEFTTADEEGVRYRLDVQGLDATGLNARFRELSALRQGDGDRATPAQIAARTRGDRELLERLLFSEGWYGAAVDSAIETAPETGALIRFTVASGERYRWRQITLDLYPDAPPRLTENFGLRVGEPIRAIEVDEAEGRLLVEMRRSGYPFAELGARDVVLDEGPTGTYLLTADIGPRGRFGRVRMTGDAPFDEDHANVIARFEPGDLYDADMVDDLRLALIQTQLFNGVTVIPVDTGERAPDGTAVTDIRVEGSAGPEKQLIGQFGYASGEGLRAEGLWRHRNLIVPEGMFTARAVAGTREQRLAAEYAMSNFRQRDRRLAGSFDIANIKRAAFEARTATASVSLARLSTPIWQKRWTWSVGFDLIATDELDRSFDPDASRDTYLIAALPTMVGYDTSDDLLDPGRGFRLGLQLTPEFSRQGGRNQTYLRAIADASGYKRVGESLVMAGRLRAGSIMGAERIDIAPTRRLYAGGGGSVRGFGYQDVGPLGVRNRPLGGRGLLEASVEGRYRFGDFGVVGFIDAGTLSEKSTPTLDDVHVGAGVGLRYYTGFGPMRVDIARAITHTTRAPAIGLYISIGQAF